MAHTPGPWETGVRFDGSHWLSIGDPHEGPHYQGELHCSDADASLIAAAPDLLEALHIVGMSAGYQYMTMETRALIEAAIAKATA